MNEDERQIRELVAEWMSASKAGNTQAVLELMSDDIIFMTPSRPPFGKKEFAANSEQMKGIAMEGSCDVQEVKILGDHAYIRNYIQMAFTPPGGQPRCMAGYTMGILRKEADGRWRLVRDANLVMPVVDK